MTTEAKVEANRVNAQNSTGPQTPEGKERSSRNALKHGLFSRQAVLASEDPQEFEEFRQALFDDLGPQGAVQEMLADLAVREAWRLRRLAGMEGKLLEAGKADAVALDRLRLYEGRMERGLYRAMRQLEWQKEQARQEVKRRAAVDEAQRQRQLEIDARIASDARVADLRERMEMQAYNYDDLIYRHATLARRMMKGGLASKEERQEWTILCDNRLGPEKPAGPAAAVTPAAAGAKSVRADARTGE